MSGDLLRRTFVPREEVLWIVRFYGLWAFAIWGGGVIGWLLGKWL